MQVLLGTWMRGGVSAGGSYVKGAGAGVKAVDEGLTEVVGIVVVRNVFEGVFNGVVGLVVAVVSV